MLDDADLARWRARRSPAEADIARLGAELQTALLPRPGRRPQRLFSRSAPAPAATSRRSSPATCCACTCATPSARAGRPRSCRHERIRPRRLQEVVVRLAGEAVYEALKFESGGHRVQRVPATETQGRIHTSACTVAVLPSRTRPRRSRQPGRAAHRYLPRQRRGGQHINKTDSAVRVSPTCRPGWWPNARTTAASTATRPRRWRCWPHRLRDKERLERQAARPRPARA